MKTCCPSGMIPTLLVFSNFPRITVHPEEFPIQGDRMKALHEACKHMAVFSTTLLYNIVHSFEFDGIARSTHLKVKDRAPVTLNIVLKELQIEFL